ncbi:ATP11-domain-containing protein [Amylocystis lapponica]|nr:ATP11-domain-containing protein [Amylocystis lapponica]
MSLSVKYRSAMRRIVLRHPVRSFCTSRSFRQSVDYETKYAEKLQKRAEEQGKNVADLRAEIKEQEARRRQSIASAAKRNHTQDGIQASSDASSSSTPSGATVPGVAARKDSSPVKPLSGILNVERLLNSPHTPEQVSALWTAYHASRSGGTGRGYLCASLPVATYEKMMAVGRRYPKFVVPVQRDNIQTEDADKRAYEFYYMEWGFHGPPPDPSASVDPFAAPRPSSNPETSTVLFTPLQEYKLRASFATPYLVLTHYTDLAHSHGLVLLRGEVTPSAADTAANTRGGDGRYLLSQQDAQLLAVAMQKFYLWTEGQNERAALLQAFHDSPGEFKWEELLKHVEF